MTRPTVQVTTLGDLLLRAAERWPAHDALVFPDGRRTYLELWDGAEHVGRGLLALGVQPGEHVGILMANCIEFAEAFFGAAAIGAVAVPLNARYRSHELAYVVENADLVALLTSDLVAEHVDHVERIREGLPELRATVDPADLHLAAAPRLRSTVVLGTGPRDGFVGRDAFADLADRVDPAELEERRVRVRLRDTGLMMYTSGTTAHPKGCVITHEAAVRNGIAFAEQRFLLDDRDRLWDPVPMFHMAAMLPLLGAIHAGAAFISMARVETEPALELMERERTTVAFPAFPFLVMALLEHPTFPARDLSGLRLLNTNGLPDQMRRIQAVLPAGARLVNPYGCTEIGGVICFSEPGDTDEQRATTSGRPFRGMQLRVVEPETNQPVPPGTAGEIVARGYALFEGYYKDPEKTAAAVDADGWFHTGDRGLLDPEGRLTFLGRSKDMLKVGGENVGAVEVESLLVQHPAVSICQVVGIPDDRLQEVPAAFVELAAGAVATEQELIDFCAGRIAAFKVPRVVRIVESWPMSATKIQKFVLRDQLLAELERS